MNIVRLFAVCALALAVIPGLMASPITIDHFTDAQSLAVTVAAGLNTSNAVGGGLSMLGGYRYMALTRVVNAYPAGSTVDDQLTANSLPSFLSNNVATSNGDQWMVWYDGALTPSVFNAMNIDATGSGTNIQLSFNYAQDNAGNTLKFCGYSGTTGANSSCYTYTLGVQTPGTLTSATIPFSSFTVATGTGVEWTSLSALSIFYDGTAGGSSTWGNDIRMDLAQFDGVPEPGTLILLGSALIGLGIWRKKRAA